MNASIIKDEEYNNMIKTLIQNTHENYFEVISHQQFWELLKLRIKEKTICFCIEKAQKRKNETKCLENKLDKIR